MKDWNREQWRELRRCFSWVGISCAVYLLVSGICSLGAASAMERWGSALGLNLQLMITMLAMYPLAIPLCIGMGKRIPKAVQVRRFPMSFGMFAGVFAVSMGLMYVGNLIGQILMLIVGLVTGKPVINGIEEVILAMEPWSVMLVAVIIGPIVEEVIFRKFLLDRIAGYGQLTAMFVSGLIFALAHGNFYQFFYAFAIGMVFAWVYLRTGRLRDTILLHMLINFCGSLVPMGIMSLMEKSMFLSVLLLLGELAVMFSMVILAVVLLICYRKEILAKTDRSQVSGMRWVRSVFLNPGMCLYYLAAGVMFFFS